MKHYIYNAGPFFNPAQEAAMEKLERLEHMRGIEYFAPRLSDETKRIRKEGFTPEIADAIFKRDVAEIKKATLMIAVLDWAMPGGSQVRVVDAGCLDAGSAEADYHQALSEPLNVPDSGTVFEMGAAHEIGLPVVACRFDEKNPLNVMLSEGCFGLCTSWESLEAFLDVVRAWRGDKK